MRQKASTFSANGVCVCVPTLPLFAHFFRRFARYRQRIELHFVKLLYTCQLNERAYELVFV